MRKLFSHVLTARSRKAIAGLAGVLTFLLVCIVAAIVGASNTRDAMREQAEIALRPSVLLERNLENTFAHLEKTATAPPCTGPYFEQLRQVALLPDGFSEFLHVEDGSVRCGLTSGQLAEPFVLGDRDLRIDTPILTSDVWLDRKLDFVGGDRFLGSLATKGPFAIVIWPSDLEPTVPDWVGLETLMMANDGPRHRSGEIGIYERSTGAASSGEWFGGGYLHELTCRDNGYVCVATEASISELFAGTWASWAGAIFLAFLASTGVAIYTFETLVQCFSFENRFRRHLDSESVICTYQPIMDLRSGEIVGCEVLARWRDIDGSIVYPDRFIPLVEKFGRTLAFTKMVVERAHADLERHLPADRKLTVNFNIFPCDFADPNLSAIFDVFEGSERFELIAELVESEDIDIETVQRQMDALRERGIGCYVDDFGTGYSNMTNLAGLRIDGVKLDRSFALATPGSVLSRMMALAIEMVHAAGRSVVVEGIECEERLNVLRSMTPKVELVQGYHISRPLNAKAFAAFIDGPRVSRVEEIAPRIRDRAAA